MPAKKYIAVRSQNVIGSWALLTEPPKRARVFPTHIEIPTITKRKRPIK
jgi:hypothetical protein